MKRVRVCACEFGCMLWEGEGGSTVSGVLFRVAVSVSDCVCPCVGVGDGFLASLVSGCVAQPCYRFYPNFLRLWVICVTMLDPHAAATATATYG